MGNPAGVPRDFDALEKRRFQALQLLERGLNQSEIARQLRVGRQSVGLEGVVQLCRSAGQSRQAR